jgi:adenosylhomocysteine nucleosidase
MIRGMTAGFEDVGNTDIATAPGSGPGGPIGPVGIICALPGEIAALAAPLDHPRDGWFGPVEVRHGRLGGVPVIVALSGVGKVDGAVAATLLASAGVRALVVAGVAGAVNPAVAIGDVVVATRLVQHDYGLATDAGITVYAAGQLPVPGVAPAPEPRIDERLEEELRTALADLVLEPISLRPGETPRRPAIHFGTVATGDIFVNGPRVRQRIAELGALAVDMEGAAVARVAHLFGIPCVVLRAASDLAGRESDLDLAAFLPVAARGVARVAEIVVQHL